MPPKRRRIEQDLHPPGGMRWICLKTCARLGDKEALNIIIDKFKSVKDDEERVHLLNSLGFTCQPEVIQYLKAPPTAAELENILTMLGLEPRELMRKKEKEYKAAGLDNDSLTRKQLIEAMVKHPKLIERPIVIKDGKAALGRPPEKVLDIL